jgi:hypothetical protein
VPLAPFPALVREVDVEPALRNAISRRRLWRMSKLKSVHGEDLVSGLNETLVPVRSVVADGPERRLRHALAVLLLPDLALAADLELQPLAHGVHGRHADAVQARGDLVGVVVELAARVQDGHHDLGRADALLVHADRDAAPVVGRP